jgi:hypothetical protein
MLRDYYAPTDFPSADVDPSIEVKDKLSIIATSPVTITPVTVYGSGYFDSAYHLTLPFIDCAEFSYIVVFVTHMYFLNILILATNNYTAKASVVDYCAQL